MSDKCDNNDTDSKTDTDTENSINIQVELAAKLKSGISSLSHRSKYRNFIPDDERDNNEINEYDSETLKRTSSTKL